MLTPSSSHVMRVNEIMNDNINIVKNIVKNSENILFLNDKQKEILYNVLKNFNELNSNNKLIFTEDLRPIISRLNENQTEYVKLDDMNKLFNNNIKGEKIDLIEKEIILAKAKIEKIIYKIGLNIIINKKIIKPMAYNIKINEERKIKIDELINKTECLKEKATNPKEFKDLESKLKIYKQESEEVGKWIDDRKKKLKELLDENINLNKEIQKLKEQLWSPEY